MSKNEKVIKGNKKHAHLSRQEKKQQKIILTTFIIVAVLIFGSIAFGLLNEYVLKYNRPVATINGEKLMPAEFEKQVRYNRYQLMEQYLQYSNLAQMFGSDPQMGGQFTETLQEIEKQLLPENAVSIGSTVLDQLTNQILIQQEAEKMGIVITEAEIDEAFQNVFGYYSNGTPTPEATATKFIESTLSPEQIAIVTLTPTAAPTEVPEGEPAIDEETAAEEAAQPTPTAQPQPTATAYTEAAYVEQRSNYLEKLNKLDLGYTEEDLRQLIYNQLVYEAVREAVTADVKKVEPQVWARHILVADDASAQIVLESLAEGKDWAELAATLSLDTANKDQGGDLGWFADGQMVPEFWEAASALEIGEISDPVTTQFGIHIIQLLGKEDRPLDASTYDNKVAATFQDWLAGVIEAADIDISDNWVQIVPEEPVLNENTWLILTGQDLIEQEAPQE
ncbi:MAG: peptidylprolyl isomerase [Anaerolineaceae bacterium]|jgi:foldase protein PrsA|nr:peptidylprolyl isomerase [Anaerolineaceae bacterium]